MWGRASARPVGLKPDSTYRRLKQQQLRRGTPGRGHTPRCSPSEQQQEVAADPFFRFAVVMKLPLVRMEAAIVSRSQYMVQVFVMNYRLYKECWNIRCI